MNKKIIWGVAAAIIIVGIAVYAMVFWEPFAPTKETRAATLSGTVTYREKIALPEGSLIEVQIRDVSREDAETDPIAGVSIVTRGENVPIGFVVDYNPALIKPDRSYAVFSRIYVANELRWITDSVVPFLDNGNPIGNADLVLAATGAAAEGTIGYSDLDGKSFKITSFDGVDVPEGANYTMEFRDGGVYAKVCNSMFGGVSLMDGKISGILAATEMFCIGPEGIMDIEDAVKNIFDVGASVTLSGETLTLSGDSGTLILNQSQ